MPAPSGASVNADASRTLFKFDTALTAYLIAAGAGAVLLKSEPADAGVIYSGLQDIDVAPGSSFLLDLNNDSVNDFRFNNTISTDKKSGTASAASAAISPQGDNMVAVRTLSGNKGGTSTLVTPLQENTLIGGPQTTFAGPVSSKSKADGKAQVLAGWTQSDDKGATVQNFEGDFLGIDDALIGLQFDISGDDHFGWTRVNVGDGANFTAIDLTIRDWAYEDVAGTPIRAGDNGQLAPIPEPHVLALLALGAVGLLGFQRERRRNQEP